MSNPKDASCLPALRDVIAAHGLQAQKKLGQNFLLDANITGKIVRLAGDLAGQTVFEIGPGPGGLTRSLLNSGAKNIIAIECDKRAVQALQDLKTVYPDRLHIIEGDALKADLTALAPAPRAIVANLPYNIATPLTIGWLRDLRRDAGAYSSMTLMFQKEVAQRLTAAPGSKAYGRLAVIAQWLCDVKKLYDLPASAFTPPPKVASSVVHFVPKILPSISPEFETVEAVTAAAFGQRRKMLRTSLKEYQTQLSAAGISDQKRAEELSVADFIRILTV